MMQRLYGSVGLERIGFSVMNNLPGTTLQTFRLDLNNSKDGAVRVVVVSMPLPGQEGPIYPSRSIPEKFSLINTSRGLE